MCMTRTLFWSIFSKKKKNGKRVVHLDVITLTYSCRSKSQIKSLVLGANTFATKCIFLSLNKEFPCEYCHIEISGRVLNSRLEDL